MQFIQYSLCRLFLWACPQKMDPLNMCITSQFLDPNAEWQPSYLAESIKINGMLWETLVSSHLTWQSDDLTFTFTCLSTVTVDTYQASASIFSDVLSCSAS